jgi:hypothetical protein
MSEFKEQLILATTEYRAGGACGEEIGNGEFHGVYQSFIDDEGSEVLICVPTFANY